MIELTLLAIIVIFVIILFVKKKRFSKKFKPNLIFTVGGLAGGMGLPPVKKNLIPIFTKHPLNVLKPEEAQILVKLPPLGIGIVAITVKVRAEDSRHVVITNLADLNHVIPTAILGGTKIATLAAQGPTYTINIFVSSLKIFGIAKSIEVRFS